MVKEKNIKERSPMNVSIESRLVGISITVFILILTLKSELLEKQIIIFQLVLSLPFLLAAMISNAKIVDSDSLKHYYIFNRITNSIGIALIFNTIGLLTRHYISKIVAISFFALLVILLSCLLYLDFNKRKMYNEFLMIVIVIILGLMPSIIG
ncbi:MAG: hypothetical protein ACP5OG_01625 [Candidatus Nanoarchaeia archaeon]